MKRLALAVVLLAVCRGASGADDVDVRIGRLTQWLKAVAKHEPGTTDDPATIVAAWSTPQIRTLWIDTNVLVQLMRQPQLIAFSVRAEREAPAQSIRFNSIQLRRLKALACAASGRIGDVDAVCAGAESDLDAGLLALAVSSRASKLRGDENYLLRRGALLHTDVAMFIPPAAEPITSIAPPAPQRVRMQTSDGLQVALSQVATHWEIARMLLDNVVPPGRDRPAPGRDLMVRDWYRATAAWMQRQEEHDTDHLDRARAIFPDDPDILFLSGCQHETYASPDIQGSLRSAVMPTGVSIDVGSDRAELRHAETFFRRALAANPSMPEAHLRLGRVLSLLERPAEAVPELRVAIASTDDALLRYYGQLFLGAAEEMLAHFDAARDAYAAAAELSPGAQSPRLALSALARRRGNRADAWRELAHVLEPPAEEQADDPWWRYHIEQGRNVEELLDQLRQPFRAEGSR